MKTNTKKMLKLLAEYPDQFIQDHYQWMSDEQVNKYLGILQETKKNVREAEQKAYNLFARIW